MLLGVLVKVYASGNIEDIEYAWYAIQLYCILNAIHVWTMVHFGDWQLNKNVSSEDGGAQYAVVVNVDDLVRSPAAHNLYVLKSENNTVYTCFPSHLYDQNVLKWGPWLRRCLADCWH